MLPGAVTLSYRANAQGVGGSAASLRGYAGSAAVCPAAEEGAGLGAAALPASPAPAGVT
jgi:hypothetical protein